MAAEHSAIRLLLLEASQNEAERLVSLFRNAGRATRAQRLADPAGLDELLSQSWDLAILAPPSPELDSLSALRQLRRRVPQLAVIQRVPPDDPAAVLDALRLGARDGIASDNDEHLLLASLRELGNLAERLERRRLEQALAEAEQRCQLLLANAVEAVAYVHDGLHIHVNSAYVELLGYPSAEDLEITPLMDLIAAADQPALREAFRQLRDDPSPLELDCRCVRQDGSTLGVRLRLTPAIYLDEPCVQLHLREERAAPAAEALEEQLREVRFQDTLTGLLNRSRMLELLEDALERARLGAPASFAYLSIDRYPTLLAELGIGAMDELLVALAERLREHFGTLVTLSRFADDAFTALLPQAADASLDSAFERLLGRQERQPLTLAGRTLAISYSIGVVSLDNHTKSAGDLVDRAHRSARQVAQRGGNACKRYDPQEELAAAANRGNLVAMVKQALQQNGFRLLFQPVIGLRGSSHEYYEALLRLVNPQGEEVSPAEFARTARDSGLSGQIDRWVIQQAVRQLGEHRARGHGTRIFVHLSGATLGDLELLPWLRETLQGQQLDAEAVIFQLSEEDLLAQPEQALAMAQRLRRQGHPVTLSGFAAGDPPLAALRLLVPDYVKLSGKLIKDLGQPEHQERLKAMVAELSAQNVQTIAPFVESASVLAQLWQVGVHFIQGYYLQEPSQAMDYEFHPEH
ncbi:response regulator receiver modulated diguanylate cyclase/phosphodiesterase [Pseudomonas psychrotolerans L19]|uniref:EAL domain-containing response regulator n=1 Tax=Pseudomonas TaxID=286 RepID=UPI00023A2AE1|nr:MULTISPECIES: GGDEF and EAL domain-containing protein [Pseudomonas]EHK70561.1 response regulator receiver modulated diguanylate cyclase/phosphodiesterase [Pseudomonas psychrotolerans L19]MBA1181795.1 EAL domain-containing protein [Pseudomonas psychrotolerans]MBA1209973.1 EAL domain-containing protein [Pseudomonas psychrotolerans]TCQ89768.1 response regulator receiver modulated diguanylate cyclase/phosphodiesterase [Pseudomonas sp. JUb52]